MKESKVQPGGTGSQSQVQSVNREILRPGTDRLQAGWRQPGWWWARDVAGVWRTVIVTFLRLLRIQQRIQFLHHGKVPIWNVFESVESIEPTRKHTTRAAAASSSNSEQEAMEQFVVPQLASVNGSTVRTTSSDLPMLQREGKESMADRQEQLKSGLSAELRRVVQTQ
ncbi:hypothetical protein R1flu_021647 [Riccia fluitans]|uniref:Uncharacterized protein n=1 Tax=Riccia fluitans TaxID=41844 RepID=A0ABD1ZQ03_9MARC